MAERVEGFMESIVLDSEGAILWKGPDPFSCPEKRRSVKERRGKDGAQDVPKQVAGGGNQLAQAWT